MNKYKFPMGFLPYFLTLCLCLFCCKTSQATEGLREVDNYFEVLYNKFSGLPTTEANDILQTSDGYIWVASYSSLIRFDGKDFLTYSGGQGLSSVLCLFLDSKERLWIGTNNDGVVLYENNDFHFISEGQDIPSFSARSIAETADGDILVGTALGMFRVDNDFQFEVLEDPRLENVFVSSLEHFGENYTFGITKAGDLFILEGSEVLMFLPMEDWEYDVPLSVLPMKEGEETYFLIGTNSNYLVELRYTENEFEFTYEVISTNDLKCVNALTLDSQGRVWIGCDYGVGYMDQNGTIYELDYISMSRSIEHIYEDLEGNFWMVSSKEGVAKLNSSVFINMSSNVDNISQINGVEIVDGLIYLASSNGIDIIRQSDKQTIENELTERYRGGYIRCVQQDLEGNLWFSSYTDDGLIKYTPSTGEIKGFNHEDGINYSRIRSTMTASDGKIWVATGNGVYVIEHDVVVDYYGSETGMKNLEILTISEDLKGRVFVGTDGAGVYIFEEGELVHHLSRSEGLLSDIILRTETDPMNGGTWIITGNSIAFYDMDQDSLRTIKNFPYGNNFDLLFYEDTMIILCSNGIFFVSHDVMLAPEEEPFIYMHKNHLNGLQSSPVANSFSKVEEGILYLCGYENLTAYDLNVTIQDEDYVPPIDLPMILVNDQEVYPTGEGFYHLPSNANFLQFDILIPTYALQDYEVSFALKGYDKLIHTSSYSTFVDPTYTNLPGGEYIFSVILTDNRSGEIINRNEFTIVKEYSFTEHPTVKVLSVLCLLLFVLGLSVFISKRKEKINKEKQGELAGLFHDTVEVLAKVIDAKDRYTNGHSKRVAFYTKEIARAMGFSEEEIESAYCVALLHDVGKIGIPDEVLNKPGRLNQEEFEVMKSHANGGAEILEGIHKWPDLVVGAKYHHERYDGTGYGYGLKGEDIPQIARIICVADAFDAMYSSRVYRKKMDLDVVLSEIEINSGSQFDPNIATIFVDLVRSGNIQGTLEKFAKEDS